MSKGKTATLPDGTLDWTKVGTNKEGKYNTFSVPPHIPRMCPVCGASCKSLASQKSGKYYWACINSKNYAKNGTCDPGFLGFATQEQDDAVPPQGQVLDTPNMFLPPTTTHTNTTSVAVDSGFLAGCDKIIAVLDQQNALIQKQTDELLEQVRLLNNRMNLIGANKRQKVDPFEHVAEK